MATYPRLARYSYMYALNITSPSQGVDGRSGHSQGSKPIFVAIVAEVMCNACPRRVGVIERRVPQRYWGSRSTGSKKGGQPRMRGMKGLIGCHSGACPK